MNSKQPWEKYPTVDSKRTLKMTVIKWVNDTFVPLGMTPIEDLPLAIPGDGNSCVIAQAIKDIPDMQDVQVGTTCIDFNLPEQDNFWDESLMQKMEYDEYGRSDNDIVFPTPEVADFIMGFDNGLFPELVDVATILETHGTHDAYELLDSIGIKEGECNCEWCTRDGYN